MLDYELNKMAGVSFGCGTSDNTGARVKALGGSRALIITDKGVADLGFVDRIASSLEKAGVEYDVFDKVMPEPTDEICLEAADYAADGGFDTIIGFGGGSPIDTAKAAGMIAGIREIEEIKDLHEYGGIGVKSSIAARAKRKTILVTIPTTAGTSAESTQSSVITSVKHGMKFCLMGPASMADLCIVDPEFTIGMPVATTVNTGLDALSHAVENLVGISNSDYSEKIMTECIRKVRKWLPVAVAEPSDVRAREEMSWAAHNSLCNGGSLNGHAFSHAIGSRYHMVHGLACMLVLPVVIRYFAETSQDAVAKLAEIFDVTVTGNAAEDADAAAEAVKQFYKSFGYTNTQETLKEMGYDVTCDEFADSIVDFTLDDYKSRLWDPPIHDDPEKVREIGRLIYNEK